MTNPRDFDSTTIISKGSEVPHRLPPLSGPSALYKSEQAVSYGSTNSRLISSSAGIFLRIGEAVTELDTDVLMRIGPAYVTEDLPTTTAPGIPFTGEVNRFVQTGQLWYRKTDGAFFLHDGDTWQRLTPADATTTVKGITRYATPVEALLGLSENTAISPATLKLWADDNDFIEKRTTGVQYYVDADLGTDDLANNGKDPYNPFLTPERALLQMAIDSYVAGLSNDLYDTATINLAPGDYTTDNRPGATNFRTLPKIAPGTTGPVLSYQLSNAITAFNEPLGRITVPDASTQGLRIGQELFSSSGGVAIVRSITNNFVFLKRIRGVWAVGDRVSYANLSFFNSPTGGLIVSRGCSVVATDLRKTKVRPLYIGDLALANADPECITPGRTSLLKLTGGSYIYGFTFTDSLTQKVTHHLCSCVEFASTQDLSDVNYGLYRKIAQVFGPPILPDQFSAVTAENEIVTSTLDNTATDQDGFLIIDSVVSSSPYVYNCSVRSRFGLNGMLIDGSKATGLKSMVTAQFTNVSLQSDPNAFVEDTTQPGNKRYKPSWRHVAFRAVNGGYAQIVSCFVICSAYHYEAIDGGELSLTNSCSNFGDYSLVAQGFSPEALPQDTGSFIDSITPPKPINPEVLVIPIVTFLAGPSTNQKIYVNGDLDEERIKPFSFIPGEQIFIKGANGTEYSADLSDQQPLIQQDSNGWFLTTSPVLNGIAANKGILGDFTLYIKRTPDFRAPDDRIYWFRVKGLNAAGKRRPVENFIFRLDQARSGIQLRNTLFVAKVRDKDTAGVDLPPGQYEIALLSANGENESLEDLFPELNIDRPLENPGSSLTYISAANFLRDIGLTASEITDLLQVSQSSLALPQTYFTQFNRPSLIRCSGHTWEWQGYLNYGSALPKFQDKVLSLTESIARIKKQTLGGRVYSTGMDQDGNFLIGDKLIDLKTGEEVNINKKFADDSKSYSRLTITEKLLLFPGASLDLRSAVISIDSQTRFSSSVPADSAYNVYATETSGGLIEIATLPEVRAGLDVIRAVTPRYLKTVTTEVIEAFAEILATSFTTELLTAADLVVTDAATVETLVVEGGLTVSGAGLFNDDVVFKESLTVDGTGLFKGVFTAEDAATFESSLTVDGVVTSNDEVRFRDNLLFNKNSTIRNELDALLTVSNDPLTTYSSYATTASAGFVQLATPGIIRSVETGPISPLADKVAVSAKDLGDEFTIREVITQDNLDAALSSRQVVNETRLNEKGLQNVDILTFRTLSNAAKGVVNIRLAMGSSDPTSYSSVGPTNNLFIHPWEGNEIALFDNSRSAWIAIQRTQAVQAISLAGLGANTNFDVYLLNNGTADAPNLIAEFVPWAGDASPPVRAAFDGVLVKGLADSERVKRLVGSIRTTSAGTSEFNLGGAIGSGNSDQFPKLYLSNLYNKLDTVANYDFLTGWDNTADPDVWRPTPYPTPSKISFISVDRTLVTVNSSIYTNATFGRGYVSVGLNSTTNLAPYAISPEIVGVDMTAHAKWTGIVHPRLNEIYYLYRYNLESGGPVEGDLNEHGGHGMIFQGKF
jgi:hypothetical protein